MDLKREKNTFTVLRAELKRNNKKILILKVLSPILMTLFVMLSFLTFYYNNFSETESTITTFFTVALVIMFGTLLSFDFMIKNTKKVNKNLDVEIVKVLNI